MRARKARIRAAQADMHKNAKAAKPEGDVKMVFGSWKRLNPETGKYDIDA